MANKPDYCGIKQNLPSISNTHKEQHQLWTSALYVYPHGCRYMYISVKRYPWDVVVQYLAPDLGHQLPKGGPISTAVHRPSQLFLPSSFYRGFLCLVAHSCIHPQNRPPPLTTSIIIPGRRHWVPLTPGTVAAASTLGGGVGVCGPSASSVLSPPAGQIQATATKERRRMELHIEFWNGMSNKLI